MIGVRVDWRPTVLGSVYLLKRTLHGAKKGCCLRLHADMSSLSFTEFKVCLCLVSYSSVHSRTFVFEQLMLTTRLLSFSRISPHTAASFPVFIYSEINCGFFHFNRHRKSAVRAAEKLQFDERFRSTHWGWDNSVDSSSFHSGNNHDYSVHQWENITTNCWFTVHGFTMVVLGIVNKL